jgi:hypothetical protein
MPAAETCKPTSVLSYATEVAQKSAQLEDGLERLLEWLDGGSSGKSPAESSARVVPLGILEDADRYLGACLGKLVAIQAHLGYPT